MANVANPASWDYTPEEDKTTEQNLQEIFTQIRDLVADNPNYVITLKLPCVETMGTDEINKLVNEAAEEVEAQQARELIPEGLNIKGKMLYTLNG